MAAGHHGGHLHRPVNALRQGSGPTTIGPIEGSLSVADGEDTWCETAGEGVAVVLNHALGGKAAVT
jgi:hypothetical protein